MAASPPAGTSPLRSLDYSVLQQCMHCGMCLPHCPTYRTTGRERNSPRGRIALMRAVADDELPVDAAFGDEMYYCLGCLACQTACPADVRYATMFENARAEIEQAGVLVSPRRSFYRWLTLEVLFLHPRIFRLAARMLRAVQTLGLDRMAREAGLIPPHLRHLEPQTPRVAARFSDELIADVERPPATAPKRRVALLTGCIQDIVYPGINRDTADVLLANGCEVVTPRGQACCGSLHAHNGALDLARRLARHQLDQIPPEDFDAIITNAGGCGSHLRHYGELLADDPLYAAKAARWDERVRDIHEFLAEIGFRQPDAPSPEPHEGSGKESVVAYHPSCHLLHGQRVAHQPLAVLAAIPGLRLVPLADADTCCGSAGIYSITQPEQSAALLEKKIAHIEATGADVLATANPGCDLQIVNGLRARGLPIRVAHPVTLLAEAYRAGSK